MKTSILLLTFAFIGFAICYITRYSNVSQRAPTSHLGFQSLSYLKILLFFFSGSDVAHDPFNPNSQQDAKPAKHTPLSDSEILALESKAGSTPALPQTNFEGPMDLAPWGVTKKQIDEFDGHPGISPSMGPPSAPVKVYIFLDLQCGACMRTLEPIKELARRYPDEVQIIHKMLPIAAHPRAHFLAKMALAMTKQNFYWEFLNRLWDEKPKATEAEMKTWARFDLGVPDRDQLIRDYESSQVSDQVSWELSEAKALGCERTPCVIIGEGEPMNGWASFMYVHGGVSRAIQMKEKMAAKM